MGDLIPNKHTSSHMKTSKTCFYNCRKNNCIHQPKCLDKLHCTKYPSYQREFQYQTYSNDDEKKSNQTHQNIHTIYNVTKSLSVLWPHYKIEFSNGPLSYISFDWEKKRKNRMIKNHFQYAKKMFQLWIYQFLNRAQQCNFLKTSNRAAMMLSQQQSMTFQYFLPPTKIRVSHRVYIIQEICLFPSSGISIIGPM